MKRPVVRSLAAIIAGAVVGSIVVAIVESVGMALFPVPDGTSEVFAPLGGAATVTGANAHAPAMVLYSAMGMYKSSTNSKSGWSS